MKFEIFPLSPNLGLNLRLSLSLLLSLCCTNYSPISRNQPAYYLPSYAPTAPTTFYSDFANFNVTRSQDFASVPAVANSSDVKPIIIKQEKSTPNATELIIQSRVDSQHEDTTTSTAGGAGVGGPRRTKCERFLELLDPQICSRSFSGQTEGGNNA